MIANAEIRKAYKQAHATLMRLHTLVSKHEAWGGCTPLGTRIHATAELEHAIDRLDSAGEELDASVLDDDRTHDEED